MSDEHRIISQMRDRQRCVGRILAREKITMKRVALDSGIPEATIRSYFTQAAEVEPAIMPITALVRLFGVIPDHILSILTEPEGRCFHGTTDAEREAESNLIAIRDAAEKALAAMRGHVTGQDGLFDGGEA